MHDLTNMMSIGLSASAILLCFTEKESFEHIATRQYDSEPIIELVAEYPDVNHCVVATVVGRPYIYSLDANSEIYSLSGNSEEDEAPLPFEECEGISRITTSKLGFLSRDSAIVWEHSSQTGKRLRRNSFPASLASTFVCHPEAGTMTVMDNYGLSIWSSKSLEVIWAPVEMPQGSKHISFFDATGDYLVAGDVLGNVWKILPHAPAERVRNSEYSNSSEISVKELPFLNSVMMNLVSVDSIHIATVIGGKELGYVEWWSRAEGTGNQPPKWVKAESLPLKMNILEAKPYGAGNARQLYVSSKYRICSVKLTNCELQTCLATDEAGSPISSFSVSADQAMILTGHQDGTVKIWKRKH